MEPGPESVALLTAEYSVPMRILLAEDHELMRDGLLDLVNQLPNLRVVGTSETGESTLEMAAKLEPDVILVDLSMPDMNGLDLVRKLATVNAHARIIALSMHADRRLVDEVLGAGAVAFVVKDRAFRELPAALRTIMNPQ